MSLLSFFLPFPVSTGNLEPGLPGNLQCFLGIGPSLDWSPDGEKIAFTSAEDGKPVVGTVDKDGKNEIAVIKGFGAKWSPDGKQLLFHHISDSVPPVASVCIVNADGTQPRIVLNNEAAESRLTWFPNGKSVAFASNRENKGRSEIFRINVEGIGLEKIVSQNEKSFTSPIFSPEGTKLVVDRAVRFEGNGTGNNSSIWLLDLASHRLERVAKGSHPGIICEQIAEMNSLAVAR